MLKNSNDRTDSETLRQKAEELLKKKLIISSTNQRISSLDPETLKLIQEIEIHQIELEMQNEELRLASAAGKIAFDKYAALYDFAPTGYFTFSTTGEIIELNHYASQLLGKERSHLLNSQFGFFVSDDTKPIFNLFLEKVFKSKTKVKCEVTLSKDGNFPMIGHLIGIVDENGEQCLVSMVDVSELKRVEQELIQSNKELAFQNEEKTKRADELIIANNELAFQNEEKAKRADELIIANKELAFQNQEKAKRADELLTANALALKLTHELQVHQIELEMQNDELIAAQSAAVSAAKKYLELYDFAPTGYLSLSNLEKITEINQYGAQMLGKERLFLQGIRFSSFVSIETKPIFNQFFDKVFNGKLKESCEITLFTKANLPLSVHLTGVVTEKGDQCLVSMVDITERKQTEVAVKESEEKYRNVFTAERDALFLIDRATHAILDINEAACGLYGYSREEILKLKNSDMSFEPEETRRATTEFKDRIDLRYHKKKDGTIFPVDISASRFILKDKEVILAAIRDITSQKHSEDALRESEEKYRTLIENMGEGVGFLNSEEIFVFANPSAENIFEVGKGELVGQSLNNFLLKENIELIKNETHLRTQGKTSTYELEIFLQDGSKKDILVTATPSLFDNQFIGTFGIFRDITTSRRLELSLKQNEARLAAAQEVAKVGSWETELSTLKVIWSDETYRIFGIRRDDFHNSHPNFLDFVHPDDRLKVDAAFAGSIGTKSVHAIEHRIITPKGLIKFIEERWHILYNDQEQPITAVGTCQDITERWLAEEEIKRKNEQLIQVNAEKDKFFSIIAHDLRSPFNGFLGFTNLLVDELDSLTLKETRKIAGLMRNSATNLFRLLENLLEWSRLQRGITSFKPESFLLMPIVSEVMLPVMDLADKKGIELRFKIPQDLEVFADEYMLGSIIRNLTSNAVKFTSKGGEVTISANSASGGSVEISVKDTGIGMSGVLLGDLFRLDVQTSRKGTEREPSTGLGLIICKEFIEKHGGMLWVESEEGKGSTFYFSILSKAEVPARNVKTNRVPDEETKVHTKPLKILIAEDDEISDSLISDIVKKYSHEILKAKTGIEAIKACQKNPDIDLVLMDINLPEMNGFKATSQIRHFNKDVIIIAQTAYNLQFDKAMAIEAGCNDYITKPISIHHLKALIRKYFNL